MGAGGVQADGEAGAEDAGEGGDEDALAEVEFLDRGPFSSLVISRSLDMPATPAKAIPSMQTTIPIRMTMPEVVPRTLSRTRVDDRRDERPDHGGVSEGDRHAEGHPEVAHGQAEGQAADPPQRAEDVGFDQDGGRRLGQHGQQVARVDGGQDPRGDDPAEEAADQPIHLPGPFLDPAVGDVKAPRSQAAQPVEDDAEEGIGA